MRHAWQYLVVVLLLALLTLVLAQDAYSATPSDTAHIPIVLCLEPPSPIATATPSATPTLTPTATPTTGATPHTPETVLWVDSDATIFSGRPDTAQIDTGSLWVGYQTYDDTLIDPPSRRQVCRTLLYFDMTSVDGSKPIAYATLRIKVLGGSDYQDVPVPRSYHAYQLLDPWDARTVSWTTAPGIGASYGGASISSDERGFHSLDVTGLVQDWLTGAKANNGIMLRGQEDPTGGCILIDSWCSWDWSYHMPPEIRIGYE